MPSFAVPGALLTLPLTPDVIAAIDAPLNPNGRGASAQRRGSTPGSTPGASAGGASNARALRFALLTCGVLL